MNSEQVQGIVRHIVGALGAVAVARGIADDAIILQASGAVSTLVAVAWSLISKARR